MIFKVMPPEAQRRSADAAQTQRRVLNPRSKIAIMLAKGCLVGSWKSLVLCIVKQQSL
jgi:hypothetical protein